VPSVASESHAVLPSRPHSPNPRNHSVPDARQPATPFDDLLDSAAPKAEPPRRQAKSERPERADQPKPARERNADARPVDAAADAKDSEPAAAKDESKVARATDAGEATDSTDAAASTDAGNKPDAGAEQSAALDAMFIDIAPVVTAPQAIAAAVAQPLALAAATPEGGTPEADALAALQAGGVAPDKTAKTNPAQGDKAADTAAKSATSADAKADVPEIEAGQHNQARGNGGKSAGEFNRAVADLLTKPEGDVPAQPAADAAAAKPGADVVQNLGVVSPANPVQPANTATAPAPLPAPAAAVPLSGLAIEIVAQSHAGNKHFEIRLDPPELGRIHVKLDVDVDGNVSTRLVVDRADTLDLLKRDASSLERALQQSGLKTSDNALEFSLRHQAFAQDNTPQQNGTHLVVPDDDPAPLEALRQGYGRLLGLGGGLDIRV